MIEKMADDLIRYMTEEKMIKENLKEDYTYALISILEKFITIGSILIISFVIRKSIPSILFLLFFFIIEKTNWGIPLSYICKMLPGDSSGLYNYSKYQSYFVRKFIFTIGNIYLCNLLYWVYWDCKSSKYELGD